MGISVFVRTPSLWILAVSPVFTNNKSAANNAGSDGVPDSSRKPIILKNCSIVTWVNPKTGGTLPRNPFFINLLRIHQITPTQIRYSIFRLNSLNSTAVGKDINYLDTSILTYLFRRMFYDILVDTYNCPKKRRKKEWGVLGFSSPTLHKKLVSLLKDGR